MISFSMLVDFQPDHPEEIKSWLKRTIESEGKISGDIQYVFCDDNYMLEINKKFLRHDTLTDIITFPTSVVRNVISGEIFISTERVKQNANDLKLSFEQEMKRVIVHGVLHLIGYQDSTTSQKQQMRAKEDYYLHLLP